MTQPEDITIRELADTLAAGNDDELEGAANTVVNERPTEQIVGLLSYLGLNCEEGRLYNRSARAERYDRLVNIMGDALVTLAGTNQAKSREIWSASVDSPDTWLREYMAMGVSSVAPLDRDLGRVCWWAMLSDPDQTVRGRMAYELDVLMDELHPGMTAAEVAEYGLSLEEAQDLVGVYERAEAGYVRPMPSNILGGLTLHASRG